MVHFYTPLSTFLHDVACLRYSRKPRPNPPYYALFSGFGSSFYTRPPYEHLIASFSLGEISVEPTVLHTYMPGTWDAHTTVVRNTCGPPRTYVATRLATHTVTGNSSGTQGLHYSKDGIKGRRNMPPYGQQSDRVL